MNAQPLIAATLNSAMEIFSRRTPYAISILVYDGIYTMYSHS